MALSFNKLPPYLRGRAGISALVILGLFLMALIWSSISGRPLAPWTLSSLPNLAATGDLSSLTDVMENNSILRDRVKALGNKDEGYIFTNYREVDKEISAILLMWAGADMTKAVRTNEGLDLRVDTFLRKIYGFGPDDLIVGDPLTGDNPWVRWFNHFKPRLLIQMAGSRVYDGDITYDPVRDRMAIDARLSPSFFNDFTAFVAQQPKPAPYINNLLAFIDETVGLKSLSDKDKARIKALMNLAQ
jgi:hypothetical protein